MPITTKRPIRKMTPIVPPMNFSTFGLQAGWSRRSGNGRAGVAFRWRGGLVRGHSGQARFRSMQCRFRMSVVVATRKHGDGCTLGGSHRCGSPGDDGQAGRQGHGASRSSSSCGGRVRVTATRRSSPAAPATSTSPTPCACTAGSARPAFEAGGCLTSRMLTGFREAVAKGADEAEGLGHRGMRRGIVQLPPPG